MTHSDITQEEAAVLYEIASGQNPMLIQQRDTGAIIARLAKLALVEKRGWFRKRLLITEAGLRHIHPLRDF